jgi:Tar ligand binding domain homologue
LLEKDKGGAMFLSSIRTKILGIAIGLIILMVITAVLSLSLVTQVGRRLEQLTNSYIPAYGDLARANIRSLERALALRRMVIAKTAVPPDLARYSANHEIFENLRAP